MRIQTRHIRIETLFLGSLLLNIAITWSYSRSLFFIYAGTSILVALFSYGLFFSGINEIDPIYNRICLFLIFESFLTGVALGFGLKSMIMVNMSILLPAALSTMDIDINKVKRSSLICSLISIVLIYAQINYGVMGDINSNTLSFFAYSCLSIGFIWYELKKNKLLSVVYLAACLFIFMQTGSRNTAIVIIICFILLYVSKFIAENKILYRLIYGASLIYTLFALNIMEWVFSNSRIDQILNTYVDYFSKKAWSMESRADFLREISQKINSYGWFTKLFGEGVCQHFGHNLFYQCVFMWGFIGTILIYMLLIKIFEMAYQEIKVGNRLVLGCFVILIGHILMNGADVYLFGSESCAVLPLVIIGVIMQQYRVGSIKRLTLK